MRLKSEKRGRAVGLGLAALGLAIATGASCGSTKNSGFTTGGSSSGAYTDGSSDDGTTCFFNCGGSSGSFDGSVSSASGGASSGIPPHMDAGVLVDTCAGSSLGTATVASLERGATPDSAMKWLYPYDQTLFPGGLLPPVLQWSPQSGGADGVYIHLKSQLFEYKGCFGKTVPTQLPLPAAVWNKAIGQSNGGSDALTVELTTIAGGKVSGPITEKWFFALGSLKGVVYYNTYTSPQAMNNGAVMFIKPGAAMPTPLLAIAGTTPTGPCISCHSLSANGSMLAAQQHFYPGGLQDSYTFDLTKGLPNPAMPAALATTTTEDWGFSAVYPDGSRLLTAGEPTDSTAKTALFPCGTGDNPGMLGIKPNVMYNTTTGATITFTGLAVQHAMMPMFSPDGKKIVFNDTDNHMGHSLMIQDFNAATNTFSNPVTIYNDANGKFAGWPFFTPDSKNVVFALGAQDNFSSIPAASFSGVGPVQASASDVGTSDLYVATQVNNTWTAKALSLANGFRNGSSYLPYPGRDEYLNFYPTVSPVAAGGYFWVFFTSRRQYGNVMKDSSGTIPDPIFNADTKKIWVTPLNFATESSGDPSHPAFYLPGQELPSGNIRAFAALAPCQQMGTSCTSGVDCCGGYCTNGKCGMPPPGCVTVDNKCTTDADCCKSTPPLTCINGFCATPPPQ